LLLRVGLCIPVAIGWELAVWPLLRLGVVRLRLVVRLLLGILLLRLGRLMPIALLGGVGL
jgi:hypothetical protein